MKTKFTWCLLGLVLLVCAPQLRAQTPEKAATALEMKWLEALKTNNPDLIAPSLSDKIVVTENDGKVDDKSATLGFIKSTKWTSAEYQDVKAMAYGNTVIVIGIFKGKGMDAMGKPIEDNDRWTDTWLKMADGKWQCIASHETPIKM